MKKQYINEKEFLRRKAWFRVFRALSLLFVLIVAFSIGLVGGLFASLTKLLPSGEDLADINPSAPTRILACDGTLLAKVYNENRESVPIAQMKYMPLATLAIEDVRFYKHPGVDLWGIARALVHNFHAGDKKEGASTITQQLAKNIYLSPKKTITRKLQEIILALELEQRYSKEEILETYLNRTYYGSNRYSVRSYGVQMAAKNFFGKDVSRLTLAQAALLAALPKSPTYYNPYRYPKAARKRRDLVLANMISNNFINRAQYEQAVQSPLTLVKEVKQVTKFDQHAPYFVRYIQSTEMNKLYGEEDANHLINDYGVDIYTSLDPRMQKIAEDDVIENVHRNRGRHITDGALVSIDPKTGFIKAFVGGTNFGKDQYDIITQGHRQPGSAFKPFVYTTALLHGYTPTTRVYDRPGRYKTGTGGGIWSPKNSDGKYLGSIQMQRALWLSRNAAAAGIANDVGIRPIIDIAHKMGIKYPLESYLSTALGASVVVPLEICSAYGTLANEGVYNQPKGIMRIVTRNGVVIYDAQPQPVRAIPVETANTMKEMMRGVVERGTGRPARCPFPVSGKTGTTNSYRDAWFIGYTDDLVTAVWVGNRDNQSMNRTFGGTVPAPIWKQFMLIAQPIMLAEHRKVADYLARINDVPAEKKNTGAQSSYITDKELSETKLQNDKIDPDASDTSHSREVVTICRQTGLRATAWCPETVAVTYILGQPPYPPSGSCSIHGQPSSVPRATTTNTPDFPAHSRGGDSVDRGIVISVCAQTGKIATDKCPTVLRRRFAPDDAPTETCPLHAD